jgi:hypothetical protein
MIWAVAIRAESRRFVLLVDLNRTVVTVEGHLITMKIAVPADVPARTGLKTAGAVMETGITMEIRSEEAAMWIRTGEVDTEIKSAEVATRTRSAAAATEKGSAEVEVAMAIMKKTEGATVTGIDEMTPTGGLVEITIPVRPAETTLRATEVMRTEEMTCQDSLVDTMIVTRDQVGQILSDQVGIPTTSMEMIVVSTKMLAVVAVPITTALPGRLAKWLRTIATGVARIVIMTEIIAMLVMVVEGFHLRMLAEHQTIATGATVIATAAMLPCQEGVNLGMTGNPWHKTTIAMKVARMGLLR